MAKNRELTLGKELQIGLGCGVFVGSIMLSMLMSLATLAAILCRSPWAWAGVALHLALVLLPLGVKTPNAVRPWVAWACASSGGLISREGLGPLGAGAV